MLAWRTVDARTGVTVEELPGAQLKSDLSQLIGRGAPVSVEVPWPDRMPERWRTATTPGRMVLVCEDERGRIWWGGLITERGYGSGPQLSLSAASPEDLLGRTYVPSKRWEQKSQTELLAWLGLDWLAAALYGRVEIGDSSTVRDRTYDDDSDKSRLDAMHDLMGVIGGPEFSTHWETLADGTVGLVAVAADRLGLAATPDRPVEHELYPDEWSLDESYAKDKGAPIVRASTTREGTDDGEQTKVIAEARAQDLLDAGWVPVEERFSPETGSVSQSVIQGYADGHLAAIREGTIALEVTMLLEDWPDGLRLGDDVSVVLRQPDMGAEGAQIVVDARLLGWSMTATGSEVTHVTPVLDLKGVQPW